MSKEIKLAIFALMSVALAFWGYKYLKGKNILKKSYTFNTVYSDVKQLTISSPVQLNGLTIGAVSNIEINENNMSEMIVSFVIEKDYKIPKDAIAYQINAGVIDGKAISIQYDKPCVTNCAESGDFLIGKNLGFIGSILGEDDVSEYVSNISNELGQLIEKIGSQESKGVINETFRELKKTMVNITNITSKTEFLLNTTYQNLTKTISNLNHITTNLAENNQHISSMFSNLEDVSSDLKNAQIGNTIANVNNTLNSSTSAIESLESTIGNANEMVLVLKESIEKINSGNGSLSKLLNDEKLYQNLERTSNEMALLLQDFRLNPKRYVNVSVFGKKQKKYTFPDEDPAYQKQNDK